MKRLVLLLICAAALAACSATPKTQAPITDARPATSGGGGPSTGEIPRVNAPNADEELMQGVLAKRSIYFDLDSFVVKDEFRPVVEAHAGFMKRNPGRKVVIEGNTDERGSREYNLALGQKRAEAVKSMLRVLGVGETQLEAISYGEERPKATGHDETAWAENRRADISYPR
ncbi:MAG TPA: peptidoglycan-associated lipoprotein Pal [Burkholderiales bacterium]|jgi:peptidoglycan-associated lipoprotein|nr:peptidoglycan-associated lipoprotein Pal [Burkholderiales bacterium]